MNVDPLHRDHTDGISGWMRSTPKRPSEQSMREQAKMWQESARKSGYVFHDENGDEIDLEACIGRLEGCEKILGDDHDVAELLAEAGIVLQRAN